MSRWRVVRSPLLGLPGLLGAPATGDGVPGGGGRREGADDPGVLHRTDSAAGLTGETVLERVTARCPIAASRSRSALGRHG